MADHSVRDKTLTAAGATVAPQRKRRIPVGTAGRGAAPVADLWGFYEGMPAPNWFVRFVSNQMALVRFVAGRRVPDSPEPVPLGETNDQGERVLDETEMRVADLVSQIRARSGDVGSLTQPIVENLLVPGEVFQVAIPRDEVEETDVESGESVLPIEVPPDIAEGVAQPDDVLWFEVYSTEECRVVKDGRNEDGTQRWRVEKRDSVDSNKWEPMSKHAAAHKLWQRHPRHSALVESPFRAAYKTLVRLEKLDHLMDSAIESRLLGRGILLVPAGVQPDIPEWLEDYDGDTFLDKLLDVMTEAIEDRDMAAAAAPVVIEVPPDAIEKFRLLEFPLEVDEFFQALHDRLKDDLAEAWNVPTSQLSDEGIQDLNHWSQWAEQESTIRTTWKPLSELIASAWTELILHPWLRDAGVPDWHEYVVWYDLSDLVSRPARTDEAGSLFDKMLLSGESTVVASGFSPDDAPDADEIQRRILLKLIDSQPAAAVALLELMDMPEAAEALRNEIGGATQEGPGGAPGSAPLPTRPDGPPDTDPTELTAAGASVQLDEASRWAIGFERDRIGRRIRSLVQRDTQLKAVLQGAAPTDFAHLLGQAVVDQIIPGGTENAVQPGAFDDLARRANQLGADPGAVVLAARESLLTHLYLPWDSLNSRSVS